MTLDDLLQPDVEKNDIVMPEPYDLGADENTVDYEEPSSGYTRELFGQLLRFSRPRTRSSLDRLYTQIERQRGHIPYDDDEGDETDMAVGDVFARLASGPTAERDDAPEPGGVVPDGEFGPAADRRPNVGGAQGALDALFANPKYAPIPITKDTYGPAQRAFKGGFSRLARFGWNAPITDAYGDVMRSELRKLVRTS